MHTTVTPLSTYNTLCSLDGPPIPSSKNKESRTPPLHSISCVIHRLSVSRQPLCVAMDGVCPCRNQMSLRPCSCLLTLRSLLCPPASCTWFWSCSCLVRARLAPCVFLLVLPGLSFILLPSSSSFLHVTLCRATTELNLSSSHPCSCVRVMSYTFCCPHSDWV